MTNLETTKKLLPNWVRDEGPDGDVVLSSRLRLARNLKEFPFPHKSNEQQLEAVYQAVVEALKPQKEFGELKIIKFEEISSLERLSLMEEHLCSPQFIEHPKQRYLVTNEGKFFSIMINEEDHLRIQTLMSGLSVDQALKLANKLDDYLEETLNYCFDENYGYLATCPTNAGTGIRVSVMLHLPGLTMVDQVKRVLSTLSHLGINVRGLYGEGTESFGDLYQISNQVTLGRSEEELTTNLMGVSRQVIEQERAVREALLRESKNKLEDRLCRSFGILTQARLISAQEAMKLFSDVKLGVELGIISGVSQVKLKELMFLSRSALLQQIFGRELAPNEREYYRAELIRAELQNREVNGDV